MEFETTEIFQAILNNDLEELQRSLAKGDKNRRGSDGRSYLHVALDQNSSEEILTELLQHVDITWRDESSSNVLDLAISKNTLGTQKLILRQLLKILTCGSFLALENLVTTGWSVWPTNICTIPRVPVEMMPFLHNVQQVWDSIIQFSNTITAKDNPDQITCTSQFVAQSADTTGLPPLQKAIIFNRHEHVKFLLDNFPRVVNIQDYLGRTALHYAVVLDDQVFTTYLLELDADFNILDVNGKTPLFYQENPHFINIPDIQRHVQFHLRKPQTLQFFNPTTLEFYHDTYPAPNHHDNNQEDRRQENKIKHMKTIVTLLRLNQVKSVSRRQLEIFEDTVLYEAILVNDVEEVKFLLENDHNPNCRNLEGQTYLHHAVLQNVKTEIIEYLLQAVDVAICDFDGFTPLELALAENVSQTLINCLVQYTADLIKEEDFERIKSLALKGWKYWPPDGVLIGSKVEDLLQNIKKMQDSVEKLNITVMEDQTSLNTSILTIDVITSWDSTGLTALHKAVIMNKIEIVDEILNQFPEVINTTDTLQRSVLHYAACLPDKTLYLLILKHNPCTKQQDMWGLTPQDYKYHPNLIHIENLRCHIHLVLKRERIFLDDEVWFQFFLQTRAKQTKMEESKLFSAIKENSIEEVKKLIEDDSTDLNGRTENGDTLLHVVVKQNGNLDILKALLENINLKFLIRNEAGQTVNDLIETTEYEKEASELVKDAVWEWGVKGGWERLQEIVQQGWDAWPYTTQQATEKSQEMGEFMEKIEKMQDEVKTLHENIRLGNEEEIKEALENVLLMCSADKTGLLPLQKAVVFQQVTLVKSILEAKSSTDVLNRGDNMERTALHYAGGCHDAGHLYSILKEAGADEINKDLKGKTPLEYYETPLDLSVVEVERRVKEILGIDETAPEQSETVTESSTDASKTETDVEVKPVTPPSPGPRKPVQMYISSDIYEKKDIPPPVTVDGRYIARHLGTALTAALAEIAEYRPYDAIEYLANWLYKYRKNLDFNKSQEELLKDIRREESVVDAEEVERQKRQEEEQKIREEEERQRKLEEEEEERKKKEQEELLRKAKDAAITQPLPTVTEEAEEDNQYRDRDEHGQTELHKLAAQEGADLVALFNLGYSLADRDGKNQTPRDIAEDYDIQENVDAMDSYITNMIEQEKLDSLQQLLLDGYDKLDVVLSQVSTDGLPEEVTDFLKAVPEFQGKIQRVFTAVESGIVRDVAQYLDRKNLAMAKDKHGRSPLHLAVLLEHKDIVEYIIKHFPQSVKARDNLNRTPLHYASSVSEELVNILTSVSNIDKEAKDVRGRTPSIYITEKSDITKLQIELKTKGDNSDHTETDGQTTSATE